MTTLDPATDATTLDRWADLGGDPALLDHLTVTGPEVVLPSVFDVTGFAATSVGVATLAAAELHAARAGGTIAAVAVDRVEAAAAFRFEALLEAVGWELPPIWDPVAGDYRTSDGWIRLHTNYGHHLRAVLAVLEVPADRSAVAAAVARCNGDELEQAVVDAGGCAAVMRSAGAWAVHPAGLASAHEVPVRLGEGVPFTGGSPLLAGPALRPLAGIRVLDLTRVIAGPVATRFLAAHGADVLRIDPPDFDEVPALLPESTAGKRCAALDLRAPVDRARFEELVAQAHVVVAGYRPGALSGLGYDPEDLRRLNPAVITVTHDAYGWSGSWAGRRGFDSLVQMSTGIAAAGMAAAGSDRPTPLPAQALDHGTGYLLAAGACRALTRLVREGVAADVRGSLVGAANVVQAHPTPDAFDAPVLDLSGVTREDADTAWGPVRRTAVPGTINGRRATLRGDAGPLGRHPAAFASLGT